MFYFYSSYLFLLDKGEKLLELVEKKLYAVFGIHCRLVIQREWTDVVQPMWAKLSICGRKTIGGRKTTGYGNAPCPTALILRDLFAKNTTHIVPHPNTVAWFGAVQLLAIQQIQKTNSGRRFDTIREIKPNRSTFYRTGITWKGRKVIWKNKQIIYIL